MALKIGKTSHELGMEQGREQGQRLLLREMLEARYGPLSDTARQRLDAWPAERLPELARALLKAGSLADLGLADGPDGNGT